MEANSRNFALTQAERMTLMGLTTHPGWPVLNALMEKVCREFDIATIREDDDEKAKKLRYEARAANAFSTLLGKVVQWNVSCAQVTQQAEKKVKEIA